MYRLKLAFVIPPAPKKRFKKSRVLYRVLLNMTKSTKACVTYAVHIESYAPEYCAQTQIN